MSAKNDVTCLDNDPLEVVQGDAVNQLLQALKDDGPTAASMYSTVRTYVEWKTKNPQVNCLILSPAGCSRDGSCCFIFDREACRMMLYAPDPDVPRLMNALKTSARIPWRRVTQVVRLPEKMIDPLRVILQDKGCHHVVDALSELFWLSADEAMTSPKQTTPEGIRLRKLNVEDSLRLVSHTNTDALQIVTDVIRFNEGLGAENERGELLGWILYDHFGGLGRLFVHPAHRRKGLARILTMAMSRRIAEFGHIVTSNALTTNEPSMQLHRSLNFRHGFFNVDIQIVRHDETTS